YFCNFRHDAFANWNRQSPQEQAGRADARPMTSSATWSKNRQLLRDISARRRTAQAAIARQVTRMSEATSGSFAAGPGYRLAHPGYACWRTVLLSVFAVC